MRPRAPTTLFISMFKYLTLSAAAISAAALPATGWAQAGPISLEPVVVTTARPLEPLLIQTDPKAAAQPAPAHDGADVLKNIPGFAVIRKGGTDGDPMLRGMAGSRLGILVEGEGVLGGCSMRMDPPTAYIFPAAYDRITVIKGPQSVRYGPVSPAGSVRFERDFERRDTLGATAFLSTTWGEFGRRDGVLDLRGGNPSLQGRLAATYTAMDDYTDGDGTQVHSAYERWSTNGSVAWTPSDDLFLEFTGAMSDGEAAYADRMMDGSLFDRKNAGLRVNHLGLADWISRTEFQLYVNEVDHVMDNFSLREFRPTMMMPGRTVSNPDRLTYGGRLAFTLDLAAPLSLDVGVDHQSNQHRVRNTRNNDQIPFATLTREADASFHQTGAFLEAAYSFSEDMRAYTGARVDHWTANDKRATARIGMMGMSAPNPTADLERTDTLPAAFVRMEYDLGAASTAFVGVGHTQRFPDYWELVSAEGLNSISGFNTAPEKVTQIDLGWLHQRDAFDWSISAFATQIDDYILIQRNVAKPMGMMNRTRSATVARNIEAESFGGEVSVGYRFSETWRSDASIAAVRGTNTTDDLPLAQMPPLEGRLGVTYVQPTWSAGVLWRVVAAQDRVAIDQGNIVGQDIGPSPAFDVVSLNASWAPTEAVRISAGIDNLFDTTFAEHISRAGSSVAGFIQTTRVNEPGRFAWVKVDYRY
jgi:iron complex outermembrane recepter protein